jgi:hypothetical protein
MRPRPGDYLSTILDVEDHGEGDLAEGPLTLNRPRRGADMEGQQENRLNEKDHRRPSRHGDAYTRPR